MTDDQKIQQLRNDSRGKGSRPNLHWWMMARCAQGDEPNVDSPPISKDGARQQCLMYLEREPG